MKKEKEDGWLARLAFNNPNNHLAIQLIDHYIVNKVRPEQETQILIHLGMIFLELGIEDNKFLTPHSSLRDMDLKSWEANYEAFKSGGWTCHLAAPLASKLNPNLDYVFGFVTQDDDGDQATFLHSFNVDTSKEQVVDPAAEMHSFYQDKYFEKDDPVPISLDGFHSYQGIIIPRNIILDIFDHKDDCYVNVWGFLMDRVLPDYRKVEIFIDAIKKKGDGWNIKDF